MYGYTVVCHMAGEPHEQPGIRKERARRADGGEPLYSEDRSVYRNGNSMVVGVTSYAVKTHSLNSGDDVVVETYPAGIWIDLGGGENEG
jgi:hypothetical protein